jgi:hypothetical protein
MSKFWTIKTIFLCIPAIFLIIPLAYIIYLVVIGQYNISEDFFIAILTFGFTAYAWLLKSEYDKRNELERLTFESRRQTYDRLLQPFIDAMGSPGTLVNQTNLKKQMTEAGYKLIIYGSDDVIRAFNQFRRSGQMQPPEPLRLIAEYGKLLYTIRKSTGFPDTKLKVEEILRSFINDYDVHASNIAPYLNQ